MTEPDARDLQQRAIEALGAFAPELARVAIREGHLALAPDSTWSGSHGTVRGYRVTLGVAPKTLGALSQHPHAVDALRQVLSVAVSDEPLHSMTDLSVVWRPAASAFAPYRGQVARAGVGMPVPQAWAEYLRGAGFDHLAALVGVAEVSGVTLDDDAARVHDAKVALPLALPERDGDVLRRTIRELLGQPVTLRLR